MQEKIKFSKNKKNNLNKNQITWKCIHQCVKDENDLSKWFSNISVSSLINNPIINKIYSSKLKECLFIQDILKRNFFDYLKKENALFFDNAKQIKYNKKINKSNLGTIIEALIGIFINKNDFIYDKEIIFKEILDYLKGSVSFSLSISKNVNKVFCDYNILLNDSDLVKTIYDKSKWLYSKVKKSLDIEKIFKSNSPIISYKHKNKVIGLFELDLITENKILIDIKCSVHKHDNKWFYQLILYYFILKQYDNNLVEYIAIYNPIKSFFWYINPNQIMDCQEFESWLKKVNII